MNAQKLAQLKAGVRIGGRGSMRRKKKAKRNRNTSTDEKRLTNTLKRLGVQQIPGIEEINMFKEDGGVIHFTSPKFQASGAANTYVVSGRAEHKSIQELLPGILDQLPNNSFPGGMNKFAEVLKSGLAGTSAVGGEDFADIPDLVENFGASDTSSAEASTSEATTAQSAATSSSSQVEVAATSQSADTSSSQIEEVPTAHSADTSSANVEAVPSSSSVAAPVADTSSSSAPAQADSSSSPAAVTSSVEAAPAPVEKAALLDPVGAPVNLKTLPKGVSEDEVRDVVDKFKTLDNDHSGDLDKAELKNLLKATVAKTMTDSLLDRFVDGQFANIDADKNGKISFHEFLVCYSNLKSQK